ncbi:MAG: TonB-dependent receptor [Dysgonamonadaceae bacterium]|jgi:TonB-linked SusC/RagA family outer membrane protein|nr:TonB-dependent receptor [Dysgonamonadaceae bacterium]
MKQTFILLSMILLSFPIFAQQKKITGRIVEATGKEPVVGAVVSIKSGKEGAASDVDGRFEITIDKPLPVTLVVNYLGYKPQEIDVYDAEEPVYILLSNDFNLLDQVVVVGYGKQKRKELTGSVASVPKGILSPEKQAISFDNLLGGSVAGVNVTQTSGQPGATSTIRIRGGNSINGGNEPLYVIDGIIFYNDQNSTRTNAGSVDGGLNPLASINTADIESVDILKDVSATAIYGSRGANGVIIITTKSGKKGKNNINYQFSTGWQQVTKKLDLLDAGQWAELYSELDGGNTSVADILKSGKTADWQDAALQTGISESHQLSVNGGDEITRYLLSGGYVDQKGIVINTGFDRYSGRVNLERDVFKNLTVGINATAGRSTQNGFTNISGTQLTGRVASPFDLALRTPPVVPVYDEDGHFNHTNPYDVGDFRLGDFSTNPIADLKNTIAETKNTSLIGRFYVSYTIIPSLVAKISSGVNLSHIVQNYYAPSTTVAGLKDTGRGSVGNKDYDSMQNEFTLNYSKELNKNHLIEVLAGYTSQKTTIAYSTALATNFTNELLTFHDLGAGAKREPASSGGSENTLNSYLGRVNYSLLNRYNLTATLRADGSSRFVKHWGYFPSLGLSWNIDQEPFFKSRLINDLKLRVTTGTVGNQEIGDYRYEATYASGSYTFGGEAATTYRRNTLENPDLKWETTTQHNIGFDVGFLKRKINLVLDVYYKKTTDLLAQVPVELTTGFSTQLQNVGTLTNKGLELTINGNVIEKKQFNWTVSANVAKNINKITRLPHNIVPEFNISLSALSPLIVREGEALGTFYGYIFDGVVQTGDNLSKVPVPGWFGSTPVQPGDPKYRDIPAKDGTIDGKITADNDKVILGSTQPNFTYGFSSNLVYKQLDFSVQFQGSQGNKLYNALRHNLEATTKYFNGSSVLAERWRPGSPSASVPRATNTDYLNLDSRYIEDASYLRLKNMTIGYNLPSVKLGNSFSQAKFRLFASVQNLLTLTKYKGYDPEASHNGSDETSSLLQGVDSGAYPASVSFTLGIGVTL